MLDVGVFHASSFIPHGHCYLWKPGLVFLHLVSDLLIAISYYSIPFLLIHFIFLRKDLSYFRNIFLLFGAFIISCGTTHLLEIWTLWHPVYWLSGLIKLLTAIFSVSTAISLYRLIPQALAFPTWSQREELNKRYLEAQRIAGVGNWEYDLINQKIIWSDELFHLFQLPVAPTAPDYQTQINLYEPSSRDRIVQAVDSAISSGISYSIEVELSLDKLNPNQTATWFLARGEALRDGVGNIVKLAGTLLDITERKQVEAELIKLGRIKDDFLGSVSHELRTPLTNMKLATHMLGTSFSPDSEVWLNVPPKKRKDICRYIEILRTECDLELSLVNDLLDLQRLEFDTGNPELEKINLLALTASVVEAYQDIAARRDQVIHLDLPATPLWLDTEKETLVSVLRELITNACKYTPPGGTIEVSVFGSQECLSINVSNTGAIIPSDQLELIFERFYRVPRSDKWNQGGTGLGLPLARKRLERLGGGLNAASDEAKNVFSIQIPAAFSIGSSR